MITINSHSLSSSAKASLSDLIRKSLGKAFPCLSLCVIHHGQVVINAYGCSAEDIVFSQDTLFDLASITKLFTSTTVLQLISAGRLHLHTPVREVIPEFARTDQRWTDAAQCPHTLAKLPLTQKALLIDPDKVQIHHLLTHTSGLHAWSDLFLNLGPAPGLPMQGQPPLQKQQQAVDLISRLGFRSRPGPIVYSDLGFILLGEAVSRLRGKGLDKVLLTDVLSPVGLSDILFNPVTQCQRSNFETVSTEWDARWRNRRLWGEVHDENACAMGGVAGHAGLFGSAQSVAQFGLAWLEGGADAWGIDPRLAQQAVSANVQDGNQIRGLGFICKSIQGASCGRYFSSRSFGHSGFTGTSLWVDPQNQLIVANLTNSVHYGRDMQAISQFKIELHEMLAALFPR